MALENFYSYMKNEYISSSTKKKLSDRTLQHYYVLINTALQKAVFWGYIANNPNARIEKTKSRQKEIECYTIAEAQHLLNVLENEPLKYQAIIRLALDTGCRRGELTGLTWEDINFNTGIVRINKSTQHVTNLGTFEKKTKTPTSDRNPIITKATIKVLKQYKAEQSEKQLLLGDKWQNSKRIFTTEFGADMHPDTPSQIFDRIIKKYNLKKIKFHALRHTSASIQKSLGVPIQVISRRLGHSNILTTDKIYSHIFEKDFSDVAEKLDTVFDLSSNN